MAKTKLLVEDTDHKYEISKEDILVYAQQIGIDINTEKHLIWIAEKGLSANVPKPWLILSDEKDRVFYYNVETKEKSWTHPLDNEYASLVSEERTKSKSLNSASTDYGFESKPLDSVNDPAASSGRFPKAPLQQLSSLADAPPLSSSGRNSPPSARLGKSDGGLSKKIEFGRIENKRGSQLAPVRLNALKMPVPAAQKPSSGMSFMPKGTTLVKNIRRMKEEAEYSPGHLEEERHEYDPDDSNESLNSDEGSKYSYEESDDEEKNMRGLEPYDLLDTSQMSPVHSADESPDALDINSLVQFGTKLPPRFEDTKKRVQAENVNNKENSPSLNLRKGGQPSFLKPLAQTTKKKSSFKGSNATKKEVAKKNKYANESDLDFQDRISAINEEQKLMLDQMQREWLAMQDELEKQEKEKYEEMVKDSSKKLEEEEIKLRNESSEKISKIKSELQKKVEDQEKEAEKKLQDLKTSNQEKMKEEEEKFNKELEALSESRKNEMKMVEEKNEKELAEKKKEFEENIKNELEKLKVTHDSNKKSVEEAHLAEISNIQESHKKKIEEIRSTLEKEENEAKNKVKELESAKHSELQEKMQNLEKLIKDETEKHQSLLNDKDKLIKEINAEKENLRKLKAEAAEAQTSVQELQDETEKTENDLDLLRSEKSALISELSVLKENINNEKENLQNLENKLKSPDYIAKCSKEFAEIGINTYSSCLDASCKASQISISCSEAFCQSEDIAYSVSEASCQTSVLLVTASKSCQVDIVPYTEEKNISSNSNDDKRKLNTNAAVDKNLEKALSGLGTKLDSRISVIEQQLQLLQENLTRSSSNQAAFSSHESAQNLLTEVTSVPNSDNRNIPPVYSTNSTVPIGLFTNNAVSNPNKCKCELGDSASCSVMQDVKNSVYHINDILSHNFVPPLITPNVYHVNQPATNYSSPFESFYNQFREMQEKHRLTELKHKCENEVVKLTKNSSNTADNNTAGNFIEKELTKPSYHFMHSNLYSHSVSEDPLMRARNIVLREQAKSWKQQQSLNTSISYSFPPNIKSRLDNSHSSYSGLNTSFHEIPASQQSFLNFAVDPETDYNTWMTRLNALQLRIRSQKML